MRSALLLELLKRRRFTLWELEMQEAMYGALELPLHTFSQLEAGREQVAEAEAQLQRALPELPAEQHERACAGWLELWKQEAAHIRKLQTIRERKRTELDLRYAWYAPGEAPIDLLGSRRAEAHALQQLDERLEQAEARCAELARLCETTIAAPPQLHLCIETPEGSRYTAPVATTESVSAVLEAFLEASALPRDGSVTYSLSLSPQGAPLAPGLTLAEVGFKADRPVYLTAQHVTLTAEVNVQLLIENDTGECFSCVAPLETPLTILAADFLVAQGQTPEHFSVYIEQLLPPDSARGHLLLYPDQTVGQAGLTDGSRLRIYPVANRSA
jgi:hypothetical protein